MSQKYYINNRDFTIDDIVNIKSSGTSEEQSIARAIIAWHDNKIFTFHTSGSTGNPKEINFTKEQLIASITQSQMAFDLTKNDIALLALPIQYVAGKMMLYRALHLGMNLITTDPKMDVSSMYDQKISFAAFVPLQVENMMKTAEGSNWLSGIKTVLIGGAPINQILEKKLMTFRNHIYHTYGMTETLTHIAIRKLSQGGYSYYSPLPNIHMSQSSDNTLIINAKHLNVQLETNDIVEMSTDGRFKILGRKDNVINSGGLKIYPEQIEQILKIYIDRDFVIVGVQDDKLGEKVVLFIEGTDEVDLHSLNEGFSFLDKYKKPKEIRYISKLPRTKSGKIKRVELR